MKRRLSLDFYRGRLWFFPPTLAFLRLQEMHRRSAKRPGPYTLSSIAAMSAREAANGYGIASAAALGHFAVSSPSQRVQFLSALLGFVQTTRSIDGLAGLLLSGIDACHLNGTEALARAGIAVWNDLARNVRRGSYLAPAIYMAQSNRIGFLNMAPNGQRGLPQFGPASANGISDSGSVFGPGMPGAGIGSSIVNSVVPGYGQMDGDDTCKLVVKYGVAVVGAGVGAYAGSKAGNPGAILGGIAGAGLGVTIGKELASDICGGSTAPGSGDKQPAGTYYDPTTGTTYVVTSDGLTISGDPTDVGTPSIGDVDDPNFVSGTNPRSKDPNFVSNAAPPPNGGSTDPAGIDTGGSNLVSGGGEPPTGPDPDPGGVPEGGTGDPPEGGGDPGGDPTGGGTPGGMADPEGGTDETPKRGTGGGTSGFGSGGGRFSGNRYAVGDSEDGSLGEPPVHRGFMQGGYAVISATFIGGEALQANVKRVAPGIFQLSAVAKVGDGAFGPILTNPGLLAALPSAKSIQG